MDRNLRSKKGISPILATLLLIVIAVAAVVVTYAWIMTYSSTVTGAENLGITAINRYDTNKYFIDVKNWGTVNATVVKVRIAGSAGNTGWKTLTNSTLIPAGASRTLDTGDVGIDFSVGDEVTVTVETTLPSDFSSKLTVG
ncbi:MAG: archaellin/type IV pilin N-terminal domain-containing protein [Candidatus Bathyarchaeia archaeon]